MQSTKIEHEFDCDEQTLWQVALFDEEYSRKLYLETLQFPRWRIVEQNVTEQSLVRKVEICPRVESVPLPIKKAFGDQLGYLEEGTFDRKTNRYSYRMIANALPEKSRIVGSMYTKPRTPTGCVRIVDLEVDVNVMLIGRMIEQKILDDTRAMHVKIAAFTRNYVRERGQAG
jgi:hypothetical protein